MANIIYRSTIPVSQNSSTVQKDYPLTYQEIDRNLFSLNAELITKAPINNAVLTGTTVINDLRATGTGFIDNIPVGSGVPHTGTFTVLTTTGNATIGDANTDTLSVRNGSTALPAITNVGNNGNGLSFPTSTQMDLQIGGSSKQTWSATGSAINGNFEVSGASEFTGVVDFLDVVNVPNFTITSTSKIANLNADRVDGYSFATGATFGGIPYASLTPTDISFLPPGTSGYVLRSNGTGAAPDWVSQDGISAGQALQAQNISGGMLGDMFYQDGASSTAKLNIGAANRILTSTGTLPTWSNSLQLSGTISHGGLNMAAGTNVDQVYTVTDTAQTVTTAWQNTSVNAAELATGSYLVQVTTGGEVYTGFLSWVSSDTNSVVTDEIILHRASLGSEGSNLYLRIERTDNSSSADMTLQVAASANRSSADYTYKFRRMI